MSETHDDDLIADARSTTGQGLFLTYRIKLCCELADRLEARNREIAELREESDGKANAFFEDGFYEGCLAGSANQLWDHDIRELWNEFVETEKDQ